MQPPPAQLMKPSKTYLFLSGLGVAFSWSLIAFIYLSTVYSYIPLVLTSTFRTEFLLSGQIGFGWGLLFLSFPAIVLGALTNVWRSFAKIIFILIIVITVIFSPFVLLISIQPCEGLGCLFAGFALMVGVVLLYLGISILPISHVRKTADGLLFKETLRKTIRPGLLALVVFSLLGAIIIFPAQIKILMESKDGINRYLNREIQNKKTLSYLKENYQLLKPTYLPGIINSGKGTESVNSKEGYRLSYGCDPSGIFYIDEYPLSKQIDLTSEKENYTEFKKQSMSVSGQEATIFEEGKIDSYFLQFQEYNYTIPNPKPVIKRYLVWNTTTLQIILTSEFDCLMPTEDLVKMAESMKPLKGR